MTGHGRVDVRTQRRLDRFRDAQRTLENLRLESRDVTTEDERLRWAERVVDAARAVAKAEAALR